MSMTPKAEKMVEKYIVHMNFTQQIHFMDWVNKRRKTIAVHTANRVINQAKAILGIGKSSAIVRMK